MAVEDDRLEVRLLQRGDTGDDVRALQSLLNELGFNDVEVDGVFSAATESAIERFQADNRLVEDGIVGAATLRALEEARELRSAAEAPRTPGLAALERRLGPVRALDLVRALIDEHPDVGRRLAPEDALPRPRRDAERLTVSEWVDQIRPFFDSLRFVASPALLIWGLALREKDVGTHTWRNSFLEQLIAEIDDDPESWLTRGGRTAWAGLKARMARKDTAAPTLLDRPALVDQLGRRAFAIALAARLVQLRATYVSRGRRARVQITLHVLAKRIRAAAASVLHGAADTERPEGPFMVHLHGAWGVGKTSLLNFLAEDLRQPSALLNEAVWGPDYAEYPRVRPWLVVQFNAWQHQRVAPPWWWLMTAVYHDGARGLPLRRRWAFRARDYWWRFWSRWPAFIVPAVVLVGIGFAVWYLREHTSLFDLSASEAWYKQVGAIATSFSAVTGAALTIGVGVRAVRRWVLVGTAKGAEAFLTTTEDPLAFVQRRYEHLVRALGRPLAVVIDDLDRCTSTHVVELLEGIQTLFSRAPVTYVVAADRMWLRRCFAEEYKIFEDTATDPGRPLGDRFLEKTFQLSTTVPRLDPGIRKTFLDRLLTPIDQSATEEPSGPSEPADEVRSLSSEQEFRVALNQSSTLPPAKQAAVREALIVRASAADIVQETEYLLADFHHLLEPNPRAMKRLVNTYGFEAKLQLLEQDWVEADPEASRRLALWTIATLRWPALIDYLLDEPDKASQIISKTPDSSVPKQLRPLFTKPAVYRVFSGENVEASLSAEDIRRFARTPV